MKYWIGFCMIFFSFFGSYAQKPKVSFSADSVMVGNEIQLRMSYLHASKSDIVFPDSTFDFSPFLYVSTQYFETETRGGKSLDSVIYTLVTYSLDSILYLNPYVMNLNTGEKIYADTAQVFLKSLLDKGDIKKIKPRETIEIYNVEKEFNVAKFGYYLIGIAILTFFIVFFFGDWILLKIRVFRFDQHHNSFVSEFRKKSLVPKNPKNIYSTLTAWKIHMEWLERLPISTMSTSEIHDLYLNDDLDKALKMFDTAIYGGVISDQLPMAYTTLMDFSNKKYKRRRAQLSSGALH